MFKHYLFALIVGVILVSSIVPVMADSDISGFVSAVKDRIATAVAGAADSVNNAVSTHSAVSLRQRIISRLKSVASKLTDEQKAKLALFTRAKINALSALNASAIRAKLANYKLRRIAKSAYLRRRVIGAEKLRSARQKLVSARAKYRKIKANITKRLENYRALRAKYLECVNNNKSYDNCANITKDALQHAKNVVIHFADLFITHLEKIKERIQTNDDISEQDANSAIEKIDRAISELEQAKIDALNAETKEEIKDAALEVRRVWRVYVYRARVYLWMAVYEKTREVLNRADVLEKRLESLMSKLEEKGYDVTQLNAKVDDFSAEINDARVLIDNAKDKYLQAKALVDENAGNLTDDEKETVRNLLIEVRKDIIDADRNLRDAARVLRQIAKEAIRLLRNTDNAVTAEQIVDANSELPFKPEAEIEIVEEVNTEE